MAKEESGVNAPVLTSDWMPSHPDLEYPKELVAWIDSINSGWQYRISYKPFELYVKQAEQWLDDKTTILDFDNAEDQLIWLIEEVERIKENSLYFCNKYGKIKEDKAPDGSGMIQYTAWDAQQVILFIYDSGYSAMIGKGRQIGFTTTMCLAAMKSVNFNKSFFIKFVTVNEKKGIEIFRDKVKWAYTKIPTYLAEEVKNWTDLVMNMDRTGTDKGRDEGSASRFQVDAPKVDAINGGSPSKVLVDEIGWMEIFGEMMREGRPALFKYDPITQKLVMQQQFLGWGTAGEMDKGGSVFEAEYKNCFKQWREKNYAYGIIPIFFNGYAKPGVNKAFLDNERKAYMAEKDSKKAQAAKVQFHQAYPMTIDDMFIRKSRTMVSISKCNERLAEIWAKDKPVEYGYFEPIYNINAPTPDLFTPFKIIGVKFVPTDGEDHVDTTACIVSHPPAGEQWRFRWYSGVDPVNSETGHSKMSTAVWDSLTNSFAAVLFARDRNFKVTYLQSLLMRLYYDQCNEGGIKELTENNIGDMYVDFQEQLGYKRNIVANGALQPDYFRKPQGKWFGVSNKVDTAPRLMAKMEELIECFGDNIDIPWFWIQAKTFVEKDLKSSNTHRQTRYQAADPRYDYDDVLFSGVIAYINAVSHARFEPVNMASQNAGKKTHVRYVQNHATNYRQRRALVNDLGEVVKYMD